MRWIRTACMLALIPATSACDDDVVDPGGEEGIGLELVADGLRAPVALAEAPDASGRLFIADQTGVIRVIDSSGLRDEPFLDLRDRMIDLNPGFDERGLLGLAFHPDYATNGRFYVYYSRPLSAGAPAGWNHTSRISEFRVSSDPLMADAASERTILEVDQPQFNHNAGTLAFGGDGFLYISLGDGGGADDNRLGHVEDWYAFNDGGNGQDITDNLLGSILRIDVDGGNPYGVPADNPFVGSAGLDEIWAYGFRNPYRMSFDMGGTGELYVGDAGQNLWEEISIVERGGNYGWNVKEGTHCFDAANPNTMPSSCPDDEPGAGPLIDPIIEFAHSNQPGGLAVVIVGGHVYRGTELPELAGQYVFGAWSTSFSVPDGRVYVAQPAASGLWSFEELMFTNTPSGRLNHFVLSFGQDSEGEVYILTSDSAAPAGGSGKVYRLVRTED